MCYTSHEAGETAASGGRNPHGSMPKGALPCPPPAIGVDFVAIWGVISHDLGQDHTKIGVILPKIGTGAGGASPPAEDGAGRMVAAEQMAAAGADRLCQEQQGKVALPFSPQAVKQDTPSRLYRTQKWNILCP